MPATLEAESTLTDRYRTTVPDAVRRALQLRKRDKIVAKSIGKSHQVDAVGIFTPKRLERDVLSLSGVSAVIWLEGINDLSTNGNRNAAAVQRGMEEGVRRLRARVPGVRIIGATLTSALGSTNAAHGSPQQDEQRNRPKHFDVGARDQAQ